MAKNLVICSDGTGNTFDSRVTNVTRLVKNLVLDQPERQLVIYDQGVGTTKKREEVTRTSQDEGLRILEAPLSSSGINPIGWVNKTRGLAFGHGLEENIRQMYRVLAEVYEEGDHLFLFGFSRGAFTVRALAGLLHRCHLAQGTGPEIDRSFERSWELFQPMVADDSAVESLRAEHRPCPVHFLGVWDTVKSYGGLKPVMLPHLRHNPDVAHVRHALAIEERRAWFKPTTWGLLDLDEDGAMTRIDNAAYGQQDISEVWFTGCHSDVGGGGARDDHHPGRPALDAGRGGGGRPASAGVGQWLVPACLRGPTRAASHPRILEALLAADGADPPQGDRQQRGLSPPGRAPGERRGAQALGLETPGDGGGPLNGGRSQP